MASVDVFALALSIPLLLVVSLLYDALVLRWIERRRARGAAASLRDRFRGTEALSEDREQDVVAQVRSRLGARPL